MSQFVEFSECVAKTRETIDFLNPHTRPDDLVSLHEIEQREGELSVFLQSLNRICSDEKKVDLCFRFERPFETMETYVDYVRCILSIAHFVSRFRFDRFCGMFLNYVVRTIVYEYETGMFVYTCKSGKPRHVDRSDPLAVETYLRVNLLLDLLKSEYVERLPIMHAMETIERTVSRSGCGMDLDEDGNENVLVFIDDALKHIDRQTLEPPSNTRQLRSGRRVPMRE